MKKSQHPFECCDYELLDKWEFEATLPNIDLPKTLLCSNSQN